MEGKGFSSETREKGQNNYDDPSKYAPYENELSNLIIIIFLFSPICLFDSQSKTTHTLSL